jgi:hypothetical protein
MAVLLWILKVFVTKVTETSTWIGTICLVLFLFNFKDLFLIFCVFAIFVPETWWDNYAKEKGIKIKEWLDSKIK